MNNYNQFKTTVLQPPIESTVYTSQAFSAIEPSYLGFIPVFIPGFISEPSRCPERQQQVPQ